METPKSHSDIRELIDVKKIIVEDRKREDYGDILELKSSIEESGLINPITVVPVDDKYRLVAGGRRFNAVLLLGWGTVPCIVKPYLTPLEEAEIELEENIKRKNLSWQEETMMLEKIDTIKRKIHGSAMQGGSNPDGWNTAKTAELANISESKAQKQIALAKILKERPDLAERVSNMPMKVAARTVKQALKREKIEGMAKVKKSEVSYEVKKGSCIDLIKDLEDNSISLVITDPPYAVDALNKKKDSKASVNYSMTSTLEEDDNSSQEKMEGIFQNLFPELFRVMKEGSYCYIFFSFNIYQSLVDNATKAGFVCSSQPLIWKKNKTTTAFSGYNYQKTYEPVLFLQKPPKDRRLNNPAKDILEYSVISSKDKIHPFQKPLDLLEFLVEQSSYIGETVLDPFCGSGATLLASLNLKRKAIGFELNPVHVSEAIINIEEGLKK